MPGKKRRKLVQVAVVGCRDFSNYQLLKSVLACVCNVHGRIGIVSGGARGADHYAARFAREQGIPLTVFKPDYAAHGKRAPFVRNTLIVDAADMVYAFWDGESPGTRHTVGYARSKGKTVAIVNIGERNRHPRTRR